MIPLFTAVREVTGDEGRRRAIEELSDPVYGEQEPSLLDRFMEWLMGLEFPVPGGGGGWGVVVVLVVIALLVLWLVLWLRPSRTRRAEGAVHEGVPLSARDHRTAAETHEKNGEYAAAVTERMRAISVDLEDRTIISPRAGRTATELADEAGRVLPGEAGGLAEGARLFNDVVYGDRSATADTTRVLRELDDRLRAARPAPDTEEARG
ncbi:MULTISPECIES: DUF4129 domain-containing protein [Nocardiopsis]|uniref:DUF4129 domain-containing protein n=1 Tax=Nocardiopsis lambiniae TaxID=3075539 RepID=A0ABU2MHC2_9ACTN|nr:MULTISPECIES: DUF4129 domain-containing protein [unclassified Nocardiopsis]MDE3721017.1 DUF4129 domain-containing protein [Nocardiopsis sp. N85]MDT0332119.1 DUF4129 domain-containing protein [Nocardiopsis sp. DSM 44743]